MSFEAIHQLRRALLEGKRLFWCPDRETCREIIIIQTKRAELDAWCGWFNNEQGQARSEATLPAPTCYRLADSPETDEPNLNE